MASPTRYGTSGRQVKEAAEKELAEFYPRDDDGSRPIAYLWARTVRCEAIGCGAEIPLVRSFWLSKKDGRKRPLRFSVKRTAHKEPRLEFEIFEPASEADVHVRTVSRANATCLCCHNVLPAVRVRAQLSEQGGGADVVLSESGKRSGGALLLAVVTVSDQGAGRRYRLADERDYQAVHAAQQGLALLSNQKLADSTSLVPDELTPIGGGSGAGRAFSYRTYGVKFYRQAFSARQTFTLLTFAKLLREKDSAPRALMLALGKL